MRLKVFAIVWLLAFAGISTLALSLSARHDNLRSTGWYPQDLSDIHPYNISDFTLLVNYTLNPTIAEVNSDPATWLYRNVYLKGVLRMGVLDDFSKLYLGFFWLVSPDSSSSILVFWDILGGQARSNLIDKTVIIEGYIERADVVEPYFGGHRVSYFILPFEMNEAEP